MTRGRMAIITPEGEIYTGVEFNGGMDLAGYGKEIFDRLESTHVCSDGSFQGFIKEFNKENFQYPDEQIFSCDDSYLNMRDDYFEKWFSDYVYIKNACEKPVTVIDAKSRKIILNEDETAVFYFGEFLACNAEDLDKLIFIDALTELKDGLSYDMQSNYSMLWNACNDYDCDNGTYLTDRIQEFNFIDDESLAYLIKENATDLPRLRCFIGDTYNADVYILDGYGNLANVEQEDFEGLIDDIIYDLEHEITVPTAKQEACL